MSSLKDGRRIFSKTLPSVPGFDVHEQGASSKSTPSSSSSLSSLKKALPERPLPPPSKELPALPPLRNKQSIERKPVGSSPTLPMASNTSSDALMRTISRKPVAARLQPPLPSIVRGAHPWQAPSTNSVATQSSAPTRDSDETQEGPLDEGVPASLHGQSGEGAVMQGGGEEGFNAAALWTDATIGRGSRSSHPSLDLDGLAATAATAVIIDAPQRQRQDELGNHPTPATVEDDGRQTLAPPWTNPAAAAAAAAAAANASSSFTTAAGSNAETAAVGYPARDHWLPLVQRELIGREKSIAKTTPVQPRAPSFASPQQQLGRTIRSVSAEDKTPSATQNMGNETSKLKHVKHKLTQSSTTIRSGHGTTTTPKSSVAQLPPTPEYRGEEGREPVAELFISFLSPASSPDAPRGFRSKELPLAPQDGKELPTIPVQAPPPARTHSSSSSEKATQPTTSSAHAPSQWTHTATSTCEPQQAFVYRGRDGTLYSEMKVDQETQAAHFPEQRYQNASMDGIYAALPLANAHFVCYQGHRTMMRRGNKNYPLTCQTCGRPDTEDRWACTFCHLQVCESCLRKLDSHGKDLGRLVEELANDNKADVGLSP